MSNRRLLVGLLLVSFLTSGWMFQTFSPVGIESDPERFRFPMSGSDFALSGTFGELRTNHFHSGIDIKTGGVVGTPLYAVDDGWVYRIKASPYGFGKAVYLRHDDGKFSVYAHLNGYNKQIAEVLYQKQYASKSFEQEIYLPKNRIPVGKGDLIGYAGNSGSSTGPHLHFEIRDPDERITNPIMHYKHLIRDNISPVIQHIGIEPIGFQSRVNGSIEKLEIVPDGKSGSYRIPGVVEVRGPVGIEYHAYDLLNGAGNHCGINYTKLFIDNKLIFEFALERYAFEEKKNINVHFDYPYYKRTGRKFQRAYLENGNEFPCYRNVYNNGVIDIRDDFPHTFRIELEDGYGNTTVCRGSLKRKVTGKGGPSSPSGGKSSISASVKRNTLVLKVSRPSAKHAEGVTLEYADGSKKTVPFAYAEGKRWVFLHKLDAESLPARVIDPVNTLRYELNLLGTVFPYRNNILEKGDCQIYIPYKAAFDTLALEVVKLRGNGKMFSDVYRIGKIKDPLFKSMVVSIKPKRKCNPDYLVLAEKNRWGNWVYAGNDIREDGSVFASPSTFGEFCLMADSAAPEISPVNFRSGGTLSSTQKTISVRVKDDFAGINSEKIYPELDGSWILMEFDNKSGTITHRFRERPERGKHILRVMVYDNVGNMAQKTFTINI